MAAGRRTRILIVDDSAVMRSLLRSVVATDAGMEVAGTAADGASALSAVAVSAPDLVLLDVEMPVMDGLLTLKHLRERGLKMPVIMCSSLTQRGAKVTIEALAGGASDYVAKPSGQASREEATRALAQELIPKIRALTGLARRGPVFPMLRRDCPCRGQERELGRNGRRGCRRCWRLAFPRADRRRLTCFFRRCRPTSRCRF